MSAIRIISQEELEQNNSSQSLWFAIEGKVYDVTKFQEDHPGGDDVLLDQGGVNL